MNKIFWICTHCFKPKEDPPEEVISKKEENNNRSEIKFIINNPNEPAQSQAGLELPRNNEYVRKKYVRKKYVRKSNKSLLNLSNSENDESVSSLTSNKIKQ